MGKNLTRIVMLCGLLAVLLSATAWADDHDVYTAADLAQMANSRDTFYLRNDLDLTSWGNWTPIDFKGVFDGQGHTIKGLTVSGYDGNAGLFGTLSGTVQNLHLEVDVTGQGTYTVTGNFGYTRHCYTGSLAGELFYGTVNRVSVKGVVRASGCTGGLVGYCTGQIYNSYSEVNVSRIDGIYVRMWSGALLYSYGGLVGTLAESSLGRVVNCYATGKVDVPAEDQEGYNGLVGALSGNPVGVTNSYYCNFNNTSATGAGVYMSEEDMKQQYNYVDWDFSTVWRISPNVNDGFPYLRDPAKVSPTDITLNWTELTLQPDDAQMLQATILPAAATSRNLEWYSSDTDIVTLSPVSNSTSGVINARMMVNAKAEGTAIVTAVATDGQIQAACAVTVSTGESDPPPTYQLNSITIKDSSGNDLNAIPSGSFLATVSITNIASTDQPVIMLAAYTDDGKYMGLFYVTLKSPVGGIIEATLPIDNRDGKIGALKAFAVTSFDDLTPKTYSISFPAA